MKLSFAHDDMTNTGCVCLQMPISGERELLTVLVALLHGKNLLHFSICACHPCAGAMLIFSVSFQFYRMIAEANPKHCYHHSHIEHRHVATAGAARS